MRRAFVSLIISVVVFAVLFWVLGGMKWPGG